MSGAGAPTRHTVIWWQCPVCHWFEPDDRQAQSHPQSVCPRCGRRKLAEFRKVAQKVEDET